MAQNIDLKKMERRVWMRNFEDGLWDIYLGLMVLMLAIGTVFDKIRIPEPWHIPIYIGFVGLAYTVFWAGKRFITYPRVGRANFGPARKARQRKTMVVFAIPLLAGVALFLMLLATQNDPPEWVRWFKGNVFPFAAGAFFAAVFSVAAYLMDFTRLYMHGVLFGAALPVLEILKRYTDVTPAGIVAFGAPAGIILIIGLVVLVRFLRENPALATVAFDHNG